MSKVPRLPEALSEKYQLLSCLQSSERGDTWRCIRREDGTGCILKTTTDPGQIRQIRNDVWMLQTLEAHGAPAGWFPRVLYFAEDDWCVYELRSEIPGESLAARVETAPSRPGLSREESFRVLRELLEQISFLHQMEPPVIHRDIKPQNIIIDPEGHPHLIDFGISRRWQAEQKMDTDISGTEQVAPPEQFGFRQTDQRSDLYASGVLLRYCMTGEYSEKADKELPRDVRTIVRKATHFDPEKRYQSTEAFSAALRERKPAKRILSLIVLAALLLGCFFLLRPEAKKPYVFQEPLIEAAVRQQLGKAEGDLYSDDLAQVKEIHIFGKYFYHSEDEFVFQGEYTIPQDLSLREESVWQENGGISSLEDVHALPNLTSLCLHRQNITDLSPLQGTLLEEVGIGMNPVTDLSALAECPALHRLNLSCLAFSQPEQLSTLTNLDTLVLSGVGSLDLSILTGLPLQSLNLTEVFWSTDEPLAKLTELESLALSKLYPGLLATLGQLSLKRLVVTHVEGVHLRDLEVLSTLTELSYRNESQEILSGAPLDFPVLESLILKNVTLPSLTCLSSLTSLRTLGIYDAEILDYHGLEALPDLSVLYLQEDQRKPLAACYPSAEWIIR